MRFKRLIAMVAALCLLAGLAVLSFAAESLPWGPDHWAQTSLNRWAVLDRNEQWRRAPDEAMSLGDTVTLFAGLLRLETEDHSPESAAAACERAGVLDAGAAASMSMTDPVSRQGFIALLARALHIPPETETVAAYEDLDKIAPDVRGEVFALLNRGWLQGVTDTSLMPGGVLTRAEALVLLDNAVAQWVISDSAMADAAGGIVVVAARDALVSGKAEIVVAAEGVKDSALTLEDLKVERGVYVDVPAALLLTGETHCGTLTIGTRAGGARVYIGESAETGELTMDAPAEFMVGKQSIVGPPEDSPTPSDEGPAPEETPAPTVEPVPEPVEPPAPETEGEFDPAAETPEGEGIPWEDAPWTDAAATEGEAIPEGEAEPETPPEPEEPAWLGPGDVTRARIVDHGNPGRPPYDSYSVTASPAEPGETGYDRLVTLNMTGLRPHKSDGGGAGWWTGFSVVAPEKATGVVAEYSSDGVNYGRPVNAALKEGLYSHYFDAVRWVHYYVRLNWIGPELTEAETAPVTYKLDFTGVQADVSGLTLPDSPMGTLGVAALSDWTEGETRREQLFDSYGVKVYAKRDEKGGYLELVITAEGLVSHLSGGGRGYWAGFSAAAPAGALSCRYVAYRGMEAAKQSFASAPLIPREGFYQNVNGFGATGILQKSDAALSGQRDYWTVLQWYSDAEGRVPLTAPEVYHIVIDATFA